MIIKRHQKSSDDSAQKHQNLEAQEYPAADSSEVEVEWSEEAIEQGLLPERRQENIRNERRRDYRRFEDRTLISRAHEEANAIRENAQHEGFEEGLEQARAEIEMLKAQLAELLTSRAEVLESVADDIAPIAVEIAERILKTEISCDDELVKNIVHDTLLKVGRNTKSVLIKVNPDDSGIIKNSLKENPHPQLKAEIMIMDDPSVSRGSCLIETNSGLIDASFSTRLQMLKHLFGDSSTHNNSSEQHPGEPSSPDIS